MKPSIRSLEYSIDFGEISHPRNLQPDFIAAIAAEPLPRKGSQITKSFKALPFNINSNTSVGFWVGYPALTTRLIFQMSGMLFELSGRFPLLANTMNSWR